MAKPEPPQRSRYPHQTLFWVHRTGTDACSLSAWQPFICKVMTVPIVVTTTHGVQQQEEPSRVAAPSRVAVTQASHPVQREALLRAGEVGKGRGELPRTDLAGDVSKSPLLHSPSVFVFWDNYFRK